MKKNKGLTQIQLTIFVGVILILTIISYIFISNKKDNTTINKDLATNQIIINELENSENEKVILNTNIDSVQKQKVVPNLTLSIAKELVNSKYGSCLKNECKELLVTINNNDTVTAIYTLYDDQIYQEKKAGKAFYKNGIWSIEKAFITYSCNRDHVDGKLGFAASACI